MCSSYVDQSRCEGSVSNTRVANLFFADDTILLANWLKVIVLGLDALPQMANSIGLQVSLVKINVQVFGGLMDETLRSVHACSKDLEILEYFAYLGSLVHNSGGSYQHVLWWIGLDNAVMNSLTRVSGVVDTYAEGQRSSSR